MSKPGKRVPYRFFLFAPPGAEGNFGARHHGESIA